MSQGLRQLEAIGAVIRNRPAESRFATFSAKLEMKVLIAGFLKNRVIPRIESTEAKVAELQRGLGADGEVSECLRGRLERLDRWHRRAKPIIPLAKKLLGS